MNFHVSQKYILRDYLIYIGYTFWLSYFILISFNGDVPYVKGLFIIGFFFVLIANMIALKKSFFLIFVIFGLILIVKNSYLGRYMEYSYLETPVIATLLIIISIFQSNIDKIVRISFYTKVFFLLLCIILFSFGILEDSIGRTQGGTIRHSLGLQHPNTLGMMVLTISFEAIYLFRNRMKLIIPILIVLNFVTYEICSSRTSLICFMLFLMFFIMSKVLSKINFILVIRVIVYCTVIFSFLGIIVMAYNYGNSMLLAKFNEILSYRLIMGNHYINMYGINLWGSPISENLFLYSQWNNKMVYLLDSAYIRILIKYGVITLGIVLFFCLIGVSKLINEKNWLVLSLILSLIVFGISESLIYNFVLMPIFLLILKKPTLEALK